MKKYAPFYYQGQVLSLEHLNAFYTEYFQHANKGQAAKRYRCLIEFSIHCFTKNPNTKRGETLNSYDAALHYATGKETRIFCFERYHLSLMLPEILRNEIDKQKCFFTSANDKFLTVSAKDKNGNTVDYEIYFSLKKAKECDIHIFINSAYIRSADYQSSKKVLRRKPISFFVLLHNTLTNKRIKRPL